MLVTNAWKLKQVYRKQYLGHQIRNQAGQTQLPRHSYRCSQRRFCQGRLSCHRGMGHRTSDDDVCHQESGNKGMMDQSVQGCTSPVQSIELDCFEVQLYWLWKSIHLRIHTVRSLLALQFHEKLKILSMDLFLVSLTHNSQGSCMYS